MRKWNVLKTLVGKELQHNRGYFLVALVLLIYGPVLKSLYYFGQGEAPAHKWGIQLAYMIHFNQSTMGLPPALDNTMYILAIMGSLLLGAILLGEEHKGSLGYLVTTPVSRRSILLSKFLVGSLTLLLAMGINMAFILTFSGALGIDAYSFLIPRWGLLMSLGLLSMFTLALFTSTFTSAVLPAASLSFLLMYLPRTLVVMAEQIAARYFQAPESFSIKAQYFTRYLTITDYLNGEHWNIIEHVTHDPGWRMYGVSGTSGPAPQLGSEIYPLLVAILFLLGLAIIVFDRISLEEQGSFFAGPGTRRLFIGLGGLLISYIVVFPWCNTLLIFLSWTIAIIIALYGLGEYLPQFLRSARIKVRKDG